MLAGPLGQVAGEPDVALHPGRDTGAAQFAQHRPGQHAAAGCRQLDTHGHHVADRAVDRAAAAAAWACRGAVVRGPHRRHRRDARLADRPDRCRRGPVRRHRSGAGVPGMDHPPQAGHCGRLSHPRGRNEAIVCCCRRPRAARPVAGLGGAGCAGGLRRGAVLAAARTEAEPTASRPADLAWEGA
jgi:hypothetical protein